MFAGIAAFVLKLATGGVLDRVLAHAERKANSATERERIASELIQTQVRAEIDRRNAQRDVLIAEQGWWVTAWIRPLFAYPLIIYYGKIIVWDKVLGWGATDPLTGDIADYATVIVGAYFIGRSFEKVGQSVSSAIRKR